MAATFRLAIYKRDGLVCEGEAYSLRLPGREGSFGVLAHHAPMLAALTLGTIRARLAGQPGPSYFTCTGGLVEVARDNRVTVFLDAGERSEDIDLQRALRAEERARARLQRAAEDRSIDVLRAQAALARALLRLRVAHLGEHY
jgi:F-type H+-transporting ATPase subunit epsilon